MIELKNIFKTYHMDGEGLTVLTDVSLKIKEGEFVSIMGQSGSGKSTLMNIIGLLDVPSSGSYLLYDKDVSKLSDDELALYRRKDFGFVFQQFHLLTKMSALENASLPLLYSKRKVETNESEKILNKLGLGQRLSHRPTELSGGQQQRVAIARALINKPKVILADEPTGNLDSASGKEIMSILRDLNQQGITIILVTHEESIGRQANRLIKISDGKIVMDEIINKDAKANKQKKEEEKHLKKASVVPFKITEFIEHFRQGIKTLLGNKVRTALSVLGILIGVGAVIAMLALGSGAKKAIEEQLASLGSNLLVLRPGNIKLPGAGASSDTSALRITESDVTLVQQKVSGIKEVAPNVNGRVQTTYQNNNWSTQVLGTSFSYSRMHASEPVVGRFFTYSEDKSRSRVAVIGLTVLKNLFGKNNPIGEYIKLNKVPFQIIGILPEKGATSFRDQDDIIVVPVETAMHRLLGKTYIDYMDIEVADVSQMESTQNAINDLMIKQHRIPPSQQQDAFQIRNMADIQAAMSQTSNIMSVLLSSVAAISLLVGGIGIMNIMFVSVTERTKEIGLRKAIGARSYDILMQFLIEAGVVGIFGGLLGIVLGVFATFLLSYFAGWTTYISIGSVFVAFFFSVSIGLIFGIWPARKASRMNPIDALRSE
ncbi:MAG: ABC transporter permease [bacterium]